MNEPIARRLWTYQAERFPLARTVPLLTVFATASVNVSALVAGRPLPGPMAYLTAALLALGIFFQMRVCDEVKDLDDDRRFRPERAIPRGLVSLGTIVRLGILAGVIMLVLALGWNTLSVGLLLLVWAWLGLMTIEFLAPVWLKARPLTYLVSHMMIMPLIVLMLTGVEWTAAGAAPFPDLGLFLGLSFANGCIIEIGRKVWAPEREREGVETYSGLWGSRRASLVWLAVIVVAFFMLMFLGIALGAAMPVALTGLLGLVLAAVCAIGFRAAPTPAWQARIDAMSGIWVLLCYAAAGFLPLVCAG